MIIFEDLVVECEDFVTSCKNLVQMRNPMKKFWTKKTSMKVDRLAQLVY